MKTKIQLLVLGALLLAGCGGKTEKEKATAEAKATEAEQEKQKKKKPFVLFFTRKWEKAVHKTCAHFQE